MLSSINALANKGEAVTPPADSPQIQQADSTGPKNPEGEAVNTNPEINEEQLFTASRQLSASSELQSGNNYTGVKLDISQDMEMGVHDKTAQMVIETNVRLSIESRFEHVPQDNSPDIAGETEYSPEETADRLIDFARQFRNGFLDQSNSSNLEENLQEFVDEVARAAQEGFEEARQELGGNLSTDLDSLFNEIHNIFMDQVATLGEPGEADNSGAEESAVANRISSQNDPNAASQAAQTVREDGQENNIAQEIIAENNRLAASGEEIPAGVAEQFSG